MVFKYISHNSVLVLEDGRRFFGFSIGHEGQVIGEVCFTTGCTGYQHTITDPSFCNQIIAFTSPHIGNVGCNLFDLERHCVMAKGVIIRENSLIASHITSILDFSDWLSENKIVGISDVDTRALTNHLRNSGPQMGMILQFQDIEKVDFFAIVNELNKSRLSLDRDIMTEIRNHPYNLELKQTKLAAKYRVVIVDFGIKIGIANCLTELGCETLILPAENGGLAKKIIELQPDGVVLSNGPGDPKVISQNVNDDIKKIIESGLPVFGICMGHQLLSLALGAETKKMINAHRGCNHPVCNLETGVIEITSQNHGFVVDEQSLPDRAIVTHRSLFDNSVEGIKLHDKPVFSVQYHPEGRPGPHDSRYLFKNFINSMANQGHASQNRN